MTQIQQEKNYHLENEYFKVQNATVSIKPNKSIFDYLLLTGKFKSKHCNY